MSQLSMSQIAQVAINAGLSRDKVPTAVAIAWAESKGETTAHNTRGLDNSYGLWQINMFGSMGPDRRQKLGLTSNDQLFDPAINAKGMMLVSNGGRTWIPWTTYTRGTYLAYLPSAKNALAGISESTPAQNVGVGSDIANVGKAIGTLTSPRTYVRVSYFLVGFILLSIALVKVSGASNLLPVGKAARLIKAVK